MAATILSGVGGSTNWLPLIFPLAAVVIIAYAVDLIIKFVKKRKLHHDQLVNDHSTSFEDTTGNGNGS